MPRIVPIQLLKCLKVLLDDNGGILSAGEVKRLASLMTKYSKKLVSKCIYVQILKCTKTELLGEFMGAGGWSLVYTWLNDAIRAMNWPLVQEILELLLLCPVDVHRLKINSAPKLVKGLCKDGGNEGVRILAKRLVEQWLKVVTENPEATLPTTNMTPQATQAIKTPTVAVVAPEAISVNVQQQQTAMVNTQNTSNLQQKQEEQKVVTRQQKTKANRKTKKVQDFEDDEEEEEQQPEEEVEDEEEEDEEEEEKENEPSDKDPLGGVDTEAATTNYTLTPAQKKASESGLVYKFIIKDGQSILAKVPPKSTQTPAAVARTTTPQSSVEEEEEETESNEVADEENDETETATRDTMDAVAEADDNSSSLDKTEKDNDSGSEDKTTKVEDNKKSDDKKSSEDKDKSSKDRRSSKDNKERRGSTSSMDKEKTDKDRDSKSSKSSSSSSSSHRSSSHKSSSSSSKSSSSSSSKSKSSSSSSSSHRSSSDKHRSDKERSSTSKDKDRSSSSSSSSKHRSSSSSKSSSSSSSSKDKYRDKEKSSSSSSSSSSSKNKDKQEQVDKDKNTSSSSSSSLDKLGKIPKKSKEESEENSPKHTSITIPSKKASMSIEIRKDTEKAKTVKTYKSQFRSHGLTEEAPPPPSRKGLKKPSSTTPPGTVLPSSLPSSLKRTSPPPRDLPSEKKAKIDINNVAVANEKPGAIKLIPPKKIQTLVETNLFSDALSAATGPKKVNKRKRPNTPLVNGKEDPTSPTSPDAPKVMPLKFYQDTLDESKTEDSKSDKENDETKASEEQNTTGDDKDMEDDDDIPLKKVKEDIEQKVAQEKKLDGGDGAAGSTVDITKDDDEKKVANESSSSPSRQTSPRAEDNDVEMVEEKKPGPGCGPNGPPGVLMLHRRKGPKKKLTWRPQESLEQVRYFELDENERCNVTKTSFMDMKNMERYNERDAIVMARRGFNQEDNMEPQTHWKPLVEVDDVPPHPEGNQSKQRKIQADRELTTLRALYFTHALIPDSPAEAEFEPAFNHDVPLIPLDDLTGNPDAVNDFTSMPWPEPRGSPKQGDNIMTGTGGLGSPVNMFSNNAGPMPNVPNNNKQGGGGGGNPFNPFVVNPFSGNQGPNGPNGPPMQNSPQNQWQGPGNNMGGPMGGNGPMMGNPFNGNHGSPIMDMGGPGPMGPGPMMNNGPPQNFMNQFNNNFVGGPNNPFMNGPSGFNNGPNNFGPMGPNGPMMNGNMMNGPMGNMMNGGGHNNRNNNRGNNGGGNWRSGGSNFQDNNGGGGGGNWRPAGSGPNNRGGGGGGGNNNNGICKAFMRGHCRLGNSCKYIHPNKNKRI